MAITKFIPISNIAQMIENGIHDEGGNYVYINVSISIVGESREHCVVLGGLYMKVRVGRLCGVW